MIIARLPNLPHVNRVLINYEAQIDYLQHFSRDYFDNTFDFNRNLKQIG